MAQRADRKSIPADHWAAAIIEQRPVATLMPYAKNARTHPAHTVEQLAASIREFGFVNPVLVDENGEIIAGHGRVMASGQIGLETVPVIVRAGLTDAQKRALRLADNKMALNSGWDFDMLGQELQLLQTEDPALFDLTGFGTEELDSMLTGWQTEHANLDAMTAGTSAGTVKITVSCATANEAEVRRIVTEALAAQPALGASIA